VVSASSLKLGGASHWSGKSSEQMKVLRESAREGTIAVQLALTADSKKGLTTGTLVWTELAPGTFVGYFMGSLGIAKRKVVFSAALGLADARVCTIGSRSTVAPELIGACLETVIALVALITFGDRACTDDCEKRQ